MSEQYKRPTPEQIAALKAIDRKTGTVTDHELVEDVNGAPMGVTATTSDPAFIVVPWGSFGLPPRGDVYGEPEDAA